MLGGTAAVDGTNTGKIIKTKAGEAAVGRRRPPPVVARRDVPATVLDGTAAVDGTDDGDIIETKAGEAAPSYFWDAAACSRNNWQVVYITS